MHSSDTLQSWCMALCSFVFRLIRGSVESVSSVELQEQSLQLDDCNVYSIGV